MTEIREIVKLVDHLTELTQNNAISWERQEPGNLVSTENKIDFIYVVEYQDRLIRLYEETYKYYTDEFQFHWSSQLIVEFTDEYGNTLWQFPKTSNGWDLLNAVKYKDAKVDDFLKGIFSNMNITKKSS